MSKIIINVDGGIGAGKSSFIGRLIHNLSGIKVHVIEENVDRDETSKKLLQDYYREPKKYALKFQCWILEDKLSQLESIQDDRCVVIFDRSFMADHHVFCLLQTELGNITPEQYMEYCRRFETVSKLTENAINIYIHTSLDECQKRIQMRARQGESKISREYLEKLEYKYLALYKKLKEVRIDGNGSPDEMDKSSYNLLQDLITRVD